MPADDGTLAGPSGDGRERSRLASGTLLSKRYRVLSWLGAGGMGSVYEVLDEELDEQVALKLLHPKLSSQPDHRQRIRSEVRLARRVSHPNVCRVHDIGQHDRQLYVTMELIRGRPLRAVLETARDVPLERKLDLVTQVCAGLAAAHGAGVLHRDVKPDNVIVDDDRAVLTDFGIASVAGMTRERRVAGTPAYIAPEVLRGSPYDQRVDVYAAAVLTYELIAGLQPFYIPNIDVALKRAVDDSPVPPLPRDAVPPHARSALDHVLARALASDSRRRTRTAAALAQDIARAARGDEPGWSGSSSSDIARALAAPPADEQPTMVGGASAQAAGTPTPVGPPPRRPGASAVAATELNLHTGPPASSTAAPPPQPSHARAGAGAMTTPPQRRAEVRVATALHLCYRGAANADRGGGSSDTATGLVDHLERVIVDLGGTPIDVCSGAITAVFGAPVALGDDAARAVRAAFAVLERVDGGRAGIDTARLLYRTRADRLPSASGDAITHAEDLAHRAEDDQVLTSPNTARHLVRRFRTREVAQPLELDSDQRVLAVTPGDDKLAERRVHRIPFVGRRRELAMLESMVKDVCETRSPGFATVMSAPGLGKSRLRLELVKRVSARRDVDWLVARATPLGEVSPLSLLQTANPDWHGAATELGLRDKAAAFDAARRWLELRAARKPVGLLLEDLQWADEASLAFVRELRRTLDRVPVFTLTLARPTLVDRVPGWGAASDVDTGRHAIVELGPLTTRDAIAIAAHIAPAAEAAELEDLAQRATGNPFFIEELARDLSERGPSDSRLTPLPATVEAVVQTRLDRLPDREREIVRAAAVVGREFWRDAARAALEDPAAIDDRQLDDALAELERRSIVFALPPSGVDDDRYAFHSALVRDVAYQQLPPRDRRRTHAAVAHWLDRRAGGAESSSDPSLLAVIAQHRDLGGDRDSAYHAYRLAGERSLRVFAFGEAVRLLRRAQALSDHKDPALIEMLGDALLSNESVQAAEDMYRDALSLVGVAPAARAALCRKLGGCGRQRGDTAHAIEWLERGLSYVAPGGRLPAHADPTLAAALYGNLGWIRGYRMGEIDRALDYGERAVELLEHRPEYRRELAGALSSLGAVYMRAGRWRDQLRCNERNLGIARELRDLSSQITAHCNLGVVLWSLGEIDDATEHTRRGIALSIRTGATTTLALLRNNLAGLLIEDADYDGAEIELRESIRLAQKTGSRNFLTESYTFAARIKVHRGELDEAERHARHAVDLSARAGSSIDEGISCRILGSVLARAGDCAGALAAFDRAGQCLRGADSFEEARTWAAEARLRSHRGATGDADAAATLRARANTVFERVGAGRDLALLADDDVVR